MKDETDVVSFTPNGAGDIMLDLKQSVLHDRNNRRLVVVDGRDNIRDFGSWLTRLTAIPSKDEPLASSFNTYTVDEYNRVAAVSIQPGKRGASLDEFLSTGEGLGTDVIEELHGVVNVVSEAVGKPRQVTRVEMEVFAYPFGIPDGLRPVLLAHQTHDKLKLQFDELFIYDPIPREAAQQLGAWALNGLDEIKKKSVFG